MSPFLLVLSSLRSPGPWGQLPPCLSRDALWPLARLRRRHLLGARCSLSMLVAPDLWPAAEFGGKDSLPHGLGESHKHQSRGSRHLAGHGLQRPRALMFGSVLFAGRPSPGDVAGGCHELFQWQSWRELVSRVLKSLRAALCGLDTAPGWQAASRPLLLLKGRGNKPGGAPK